MASYGLTLKEAISIRANLTNEQKHKLEEEAISRLSDWSEDHDEKNVMAEVYRIIRFEDYKEIMG